jgi:hypothetical protein
MTHIDMDDMIKETSEKRQAMQMNHYILEMTKLHKDISFVLDDFPDVYICPAILADGRLEYQVSNGLPGRRGDSFDCHTWRDVRLLVKQMQEQIDKL